MPKRYFRNSAVLFKLEVNEGTDSIPVPATDAMLVSNLTWKRNIKYVNVEEVRPYFGEGVDLAAYTFIQGSFDMKLAGSGTAGTVPPWGDVLRCAAFGETITAVTRVDYTPVSGALESGSMYLYDDGTVDKCLGTKINITGLKMGFGDVVIMSCEFMGIDGGQTAAANPALTLTPWKQPLPINTANSGLLTLGCTYNAGALAGGTTYPSQGIELSLGGKIGFAEILGGEAIDFSDRAVTGKIVLDATAAQDVSNLASVKAGTLQGVGLLHGTTAGYKILTHMPNVQLKNPTRVNLNGKRCTAYDLKAVPTAGAGNDELRIVSL